MKNYRKLVCVLLFVVSLSVLFAQKITLKIASVSPDNSPWDVEQKKMAQEWSDITGGQVTLKFLSATALGGENGVVQKLRVSRPVQKSPLDGAVFTNIGVYELAPDSNVLSLCVPYMFRNQEELTAVLDKLTPEMSAAIEKQGFLLMGWFNVGWANFITKTEVHTPKELKAVKLSVGGITSPELGRAFQLAGYATEDVANEKMTASVKSSNGVGGLYTIPMYAYALQYHKILPYIIEDPICPIMAGFVISEKAWASIPDKFKPELQKSIEKTEQLFIDIQQKNDSDYLKLMEKEGAKLIKLSKDEKTLWEESLYTDAIKMSESKEIKVVNYDFYKKINAIIEEYRKTH